jgi:hypothetical protein
VSWLVGAREEMLSEVNIAELLIAVVLTLVSYVAGLFTDDVRELVERLRERFGPPRVGFSGHYHTKWDKGGNRPQRELVQILERRGRILCRVLYAIDASTTYEAKGTLYVDGAVSLTWENPEKSIAGTVHMAKKSSGFYEGRWTGESPTARTEVKGGEWRMRRIRPTEVPVPDLPFKPDEHRRALAELVLLSFTLVVHPPSLCHFRQSAKARASTGMMASAPSPETGMTMGIPVYGGVLHGFADCSPGLESAPLQCQGPQYLPAGLNEGEVRRILRLTDEFPARMRQRAPQDIGGPMGTQMIHERIDPLHVRGNPGLYPRQAVDIVGCRPPRIRRRQRFAVGGLAGPKAIALAPAPIINLRSGPPDGARHPAPRCRGRRPLRWGQRRGGLDGYQLLSRKTLGALRPPLIQADDATMGWRRRGERREAPLFSAKAGSTRAPPQVSC